MHPLGDRNTMVFRPFGHGPDAIFSVSDPTPQEQTCRWPFATPVSIPIPKLRPEGFRCQNYHANLFDPCRLIRAEYLGGYKFLH